MTHLLTHYEDIKGSAELITYLETAKVSGADWQVLKGIYKKLEQEPDEAALIAVIYNIDQASFNYKAKQFPSAATLGYMKRRIVRYLRQLAVNEPENYVRICAGLLKKQKLAIDIKYQWVVVDIILGGSKRYEQTRHGRGKFVQTKQHNIYRTEEKYPEIWDNHLSVLKDILLTGGLAIQVYEFAVKVLLRNQQNISDFIFTQVARFYESSSPWLWSVANEQCFEAIARGSLHDVKLMAYTYFYAPPNRRTQLWRAFQEINNVPEEKPSFLRQLVNYFMDDVSIKQKNQWMTDFMEALNTITFKHIALGNFSRRVLTSIEVLSSDLNNLSANLVQENTVALLKSRQPILEELVFTMATQAHAQEIKDWLQVFESANVQQQERIYDIFTNKCANKSFNGIVLKDLIYHPSFFVANFAWKIAAQTPKRHGQLVQNLVQQNWWSIYSSTTFQHMLQSTYGCDLILFHCQRQLQNWTYYKDKFIYMMQLAQGDLKTWLTDLLIENARQGPSDWLYQLRGLENKEALWNRIKSSKAFTKIKVHFITNYLLSNDAFLHQAAWHIIHRQMHHAKIYQIILYAVVVNGSPQQGERFLQAILQLENEDIKNRFLKALKTIIAKSPQLVGQFAAIFDQIIPDLDTDGLLMLIEMVDDEQWAKMKVTIGNHLVKGETTDFWLKALKAIPAAENNRLYERLIEDTNILENLYNVNSIKVLEVKHPIFANLLTQWIQRHQHLFATNSAALQSACVHPVADVRNWAIQRATALGMSVTFALQLLESGMPDAVELGKTFFQQLSPKDEEVFDNIMMLCDSPKVEVRTFGMQLFHQKKEQIKSPMALAFLSEHADSQIQAFVAEQVMKTKIGKKAFVKPFDDSVLRSRNRSRKAKELIKNRIENQDLSTQNNQMTSPATLLQLARSTNKLDAEWAIQQLTKRALAGEEIEGFAFA